MGISCFGYTIVMSCFGYTMGMSCFGYTMCISCFEYTMGMLCFEYTMNVCHVLDTLWVCHVLDTPWVYNVWIHHGYVDLMKHVRYWVRFFKLAKCKNHESRCSHLQSVNVKLRNFYSIQHLICN